MDSTEISSSQLLSILSAAFAETDGSLEAVTERIGVLFAGDRRGLAFAVGVAELARYGAAEWGEGDTAVEAEGECHHRTLSGPLSPRSPSTTCPLVGLRTDLDGHHSRLDSVGRSHRRWCRSRALVRRFGLVQFRCVRCDSSSRGRRPLRAR